MTNNYLHAIVNNIPTLKVNLAYSSTPHLGSNGIFKCSWCNQLIGWNKQTVFAVYEDNYERDHNYMIV